MKRSKNIGIVGWSTGDNSFGVSKAYLTYFRQYGNVHIMTPQHPDDIWKLDLIVLPGGADVNPARYNEIPGFTTGMANPFLEWFDEKILPKYIEKGVPLFGICRGFQSLYVHFGVPLEQEILGWHPYSSKGRNDEVHELFLPTQFGENSGKFIGKAQQKVNSLHHQAVLWNDASKKCAFKPTLIAEDKWVVEAAEHESLPIAAVQWHPEEIYDDYSNQTIKKLLKL